MTELQRAVLRKLDQGSRVKFLNTLRRILINKRGLPVSDFDLITAEDADIDSAWEKIHEGLLPEN